MKSSRTSRLPLQPPELGVAQALHGVDVLVHEEGVVAAGVAEVARPVRVPDELVVVARRPVLAQDVVDHHVAERPAPGQLLVVGTGPEPAARTQTASARPAARSAPVSAVLCCRASGHVCLPAES